MPLESAYLHVVHISILQVCLTYHRSVHRYGAFLWVELYCAQIRRDYCSVVAHLSNVGALLAGPHTSRWVKLVAHFLSSQLTIFVSLVEGNLQLHWIPCSNLRVLPFYGDRCSAFCGLWDGWRDAPNGLLDRVLTMLLRIHCLFLFRFDASGLSCFVQQTAPLRLSRRTEGKHAHQRHNQKCRFTFHNCCHFLLG